jgi:hypothetical protein
LKEKISPILALIAIGCFLTPVLGGQIPTDSVGLDTSALSAILNGGALPILQHALLATPFLLALGILFTRRKVLQVPGRTLGIFLAAFFGLILATFAPSSFKGSSLPLTLEWITYGAALYATVGGIGRRTGPRIVLLSIFFGCVVTSLKGVLEYGQMKSIDPTWRIFGGWVNPNALAAILLVGIFLGIGLALSEQGLLQLICAVFTVPQVIAVVLTKSRGALLVLVLGLILLVLMLIVWCSKKASKSLVASVTGVVLLAVGFCCVVAPIAQPLLPVTQKAADVQITAEQAGLGRLTGSGLSTDQSTYFRRLLWKGTGPIMKGWPLGLGMGNYRFVSAKSGLTTQTQLAHEGYLQLAVDATVLAPVLLAAILFLWVLNVCRTPHSLPKEQNILRASAIAAVFSVLAHNVIDSDFYYFGIGLLTFVLIGVTLMLSADAVAPEFTPAPLRRTAAAAVALLLFGLYFTGGIELLKARLRFELQQQDATGAMADVQTLMQLGSYDSDAWDLAARSPSTPQERLTRLETAAEKGPSTRVLRALAHAQQAMGQTGTAVTTLNKALELDPNNLTTLFQLMSLEQQTNEPEAKLTASRLVAVEDSLYFKIRSLPELVPTETFAARDYLAESETSSRKKVDLLLPAVRGYVEFAAHTVPQIISQGPAGDYGGENITSATRKLQDGIAIVKEAQRAAGATDDRADADEAAKAGVLLDAALAKLAASVTK